MALLVGGFALGAIVTTVFNMRGLEVFVPLTRTADSAYTAFSLAHLGDALNLLLLVAPLGLVGIVLWITHARDRSGRVSSRLQAARGILAGFLSS